MSKIGYCHTLLINSIIASIGFAAENVDVRMHVDLVDGTHLAGTTDTTMVLVQTSYASIDIPLTQIQTISFDKDPGNVSLALRNGDRISGRLEPDHMHIQTLAGKLKVSWSMVSSICIETNPKEKTGLVLHYNFDSDSKVIDLSGKGNHGRLAGPTWIANGRSGGAYRFDGEDDYIDCGTSPSLQLSNGLTYCVWFRSDDDHEGQLLGRRTGQDTAYDIASHLTFRATGGVAGGICGTVYAPGKNVRYMPREIQQRLGDGNWHHVALVYQPGQSLTLYIDGQIADEQSSGVFSKLNTKNLPVRIGAAVSKHFFKGDIDDVMVFNRSLNSLQIKSIFNSNN